MTYIILASSVLLTVIAHTLMKLGSAAGPEKTGGLVNMLLAYAKSPFVVGGFAVSAVAAVLWTYVLSETDLSYAYFVASIAYIFILLVSIFIFEENISPMRWIGCAFILIGVLFVVRSE